MNGEKGARLNLVCTMMLFGTIGTLSRYIDMPSSIMSLVRAFIGAAVIFLFLKIRKRAIAFDDIRRNFKLIAPAGILMGVNWVLMFETYNYTTVATGTLCYYMEPIFVIIAAIVILKEKLTLRKAVCVLVALIGMVFVSGILKTGISDASEFIGVFYGLAAAVFYASVIMLNKMMKNISSVDSTMAELAIAGITLLPYTLMTEDLGAVNYTVHGVVLLIILGAVYTGAGYIVYFNSLSRLPAQTVAIMSYIDPVEAVLLSAFLLHENVDAYTIIGAIMILGATFVSEMPPLKKE